MNWQTKINYLIGHPIGVSFIDGTGKSGVLCYTKNGELFLMEYLYHEQFALKHYEFQLIQDIHPFPSCYYRVSKFCLEQNLLFPIVRKMII
ncbi:hypothetical protein [Bacillus sp. JCM 19041]|uniref:hypothetical protein n=1 Tax=Bacillus sp. JCM 19041 TaxID=1460637 RepID=UPI0006D07C66